MTIRGDIGRTKFQIAIKNWPHVQAILVAYNVEEYFLTEMSEGEIALTLRSEIARDLFMQLTALAV